MKSFPIGVIIESFKKPLLECLDLTKSIGAQGLQLYATRGETAPENLTGEKRRAFLNEVKARGLKISALCGDLGHGFWDIEQNPELIRRSKLILEMAKELETDIVTTHIGVVPSDPNHPRYKILQDACGELAAYADSLDAHFAIETGPETSLTLKNFLDSLNSTGVAVNLDPANLVMVTGDDPVKAVHNLKKYIVHTHAKDGVKLGDNDPEVVYGIVHKDALVTDRSFEEVPLGKGSVPFKEYLAALEEIGYDGFLTIEREVGPDPVGDIRMAADFLRSFMK